MEVSKNSRKRTESVLFSSYKDALGAEVSGHGLFASIQGTDEVSISILLHRLRSLS